MNFCQEGVLLGADTRSWWSISGSATAFASTRGCVNPDEFSKNSGTCKAGWGWFEVIFRNEKGESRARLMSARVQFQSELRAIFEGGALKGGYLDSNCESKHKGLSNELGGLT